MKIAVFDTETTGLLKPASVPLDKQPQIIELGIAIVERGQVVSEHNWLINPGRNLPEEIVKITGITDLDLVGQPNFEEVWESRGARELISSCAAVLAHNLPFDRGMVDNEVSRMYGEPFQGWPAKQLCSAAEFEHAFGRRPRLIQLYERYVGRPLAQTHRAIEDVRATVEALQAAKFFEMLEDENA